LIAISLQGVTTFFDMSVGCAAWRTAISLVSATVQQVAGRRMLIARRRGSDDERGSAVPVSDTIRHGLTRVAEPVVLFPVIAILLLTVIWTATVGLIRLNHTDAEHAASVSSRELLDTYDAQVARALHEVDQTLKLVKYWREAGQGSRALAELRAKGLLLPDLVFTVSITNRHGAVVDSTQAPQKLDVANDDYFGKQRDSDTFFVGRPVRDPAGVTKLYFSRRLSAPDGAFDGAVVVAVDAGYFVSGYDTTKLGEHGVLGIVGTDGVVRVRRTGESEFSGDVIDYASMVPGADAVDAGTTISTSSWDGVRRWISARELYGFPLAIIVGLSVDEQLAAAHRQMITYLWRAGFVSIVVIVLTGILGRLSWQLSQSRIREGETKVANRAKDLFLASMSHEIRTPMNGIIGTLDVLNQSSLIGPQLELVNLIRESADSLLTIIDDILDFSKIEAGRLEIEHLPMSVAEVVEKSCNLANRLALRKGGTLTVFADPLIPTMLLGDASRLRQILINLINNAIKFSSGREHPGRVSVRAVLVDRQAGHAVVEFRVTDNGIGMDETTVAKVFTSFTQADPSTTRKYGGTGLGLVICKQLASLMGGGITVETKVDRGSTFTVRVPFDLAPEPADTAQGASEIGGLTCLVIGEHAGLADDLATYLEADAASVARVPDLAAARERTREGQRGLAVWIVDAGEDQAAFGELQSALRTRAELDLQVVFVVIGRGRRRNPRAEADGVVMIDGNALNRHTLAKAVAVAAGRASVEPEAPSGQHRTVTVPTPSRDEAIKQHRLVLVAEDNEINQKVIRQQLDLLGYAADVATTGREALKRWQSGNYALLLTDLHMPEMDGYDLALQIRVAEAGRSRMPIIALTANALRGESDRCLAVGMNDYLSKPAPLAALAVALEKWLPIDGSTTTPQRTASAPVDVSVLEALIGTDPQVIKEVLQDFTVSAARLSSELAEACAAQRAPQAAAIAHKLKSSARSVGALKLGHLCADIERAGHAGDLAAMAALLPDFETETRTVDEWLNTLHLGDPTIQHCA
jgi:signal transduction histidine kinase/CheY-like chemotaxis protein/HPt (histidine-containing phosphotransfer) domain-containing protein